MNTTRDTDRVVLNGKSAALETDTEAATLKLLDYCRANNWAGYDPYDALNSPIFRVLPFLDRRIPRLVLTQSLKRSPVNFRRLLHIPRTQNPKGVALFLSALLKLHKLNATNLQDEIDLMIERLRDLRSPGTQYSCWGYSFPWQTRSLVVPAGVPNLVCTSFVANALLDAFDQYRDPRCLNMALSAVDYVLDELYWSDDGAAGFAYPSPSVRTPVHNANLLAAALLCRAYAHTKDERFLAPALRVARYSAAKQNLDGSWHYGEAPSQRWIDNFHTGYNLCALRAISQYSASTEFDETLRRGFGFYLSHFFRQDGSVTYFHDRTYPIDIHCVAQSVVTLLSLKELDPRSVPLAHSVLEWALTHLWDQRGFFYYRILRVCTNRISYMRWSQAWMLLAMATFLEDSKCDRTKELNCRFACCAEGE